MGVTGCERSGSPIRLTIYSMKGSFDVLFNAYFWKKKTGIAVL